MKNKTIAIVINTSWNIYNFRLGLLLALQKEGYKIVAIAPRDDYSDKLEKMGFEYYSISINNKGTNPAEEIALVYAFYKLYKQVAPDILLQYTIKPNIYGSMAAGMLGIPVISNISGLGTVFLNDSFSSKVARILYKIALQIPKKVFFQNSCDQELFISKKLVKESKTGLLPGSGINTEKFLPAINNKLSSSVSFLMIARLVKDKGIIEYVEAAKKIKIRYPNVEFSILGAFYSGNPTAITEEEMKQWVNKGIIRYLGMSDDVQSIIEGYDCVVLPSYREGLSRVLLEAASMAKPIIATDVPGCREVVDDGQNGYLCSVKNIASLVEQMQKIIDLDESAREAMGRNGRKKVIREYDEKLVIQKYSDALTCIRARI